MSDETLLYDWVASCRYDPLKFANEGFEWGRGDLRKWAGLDAWQREYLVELGQEVERAEREGGPVRMATASGHGSGKTALTAIIILWYMSTRPDCVGTVTANTERQLSNRTWRELAKWRSLCLTGHWFVQEKTKLFHVERPDTWFTVAVPWSENNSEAFAGQHETYTFMLFDEGSAIADVIYEVASGAMTTAGAMWLVFGNPTKNTGFFHKIFHKLRHRWKCRNIDSRNAKAADKAYLQELVEDFGEDSDYVRVRVLGLFPRHASGQFIPTEWVEDAQTRKLEPRDYDRYSISLGVDVARFGDDRTVFVWRQGPKVIKVEKFQGLDLQVVSRYVMGAIEDRAMPVSACFVDEIGYGAAVVDMCRHAGLDVIGVNSSYKSAKPRLHANVRVDLWDEMKTWVRTADIPDDDEQLFADLTGPEYHYRDKSNLLALERKEDMKRRGLDSPDVADALALTFFAPAFELRDTDMSWRQGQDDDWGQGRSIATGY